MAAPSREVPGTGAPSRRGARTPAGRRADEAEILAVAADGVRRARLRRRAGGRDRRQTRTTKRMIYYYFGGKEQLYIAVLERAYSGIRGPSSRSTSTISTRSMPSARWPG